MNKNSGQVPLEITKSFIGQVKSLLKKFSSRRFLTGQVLIESLIAISLGMIGLLGILSLVSRSLYLQNDLQMQFSANYLAAEGIEMVRSVIDETYEKGADKKYLQPNPWGEAVNIFANGGKYEISFDGTRSEVSGASPDSLTTLSIKNGVYGYFEAGAGVSSTLFKREVEIDTSDEVKISVISRVYWTSRGEEKNLFLQDIFYNWR
jgi:Tfp pilus assembly protein PilV